MTLDAEDKAKGLDSAVIGRWLLALAAGLAVAVAVWRLTPYHGLIALGLGLVLAALVYMLLRRLGLPYTATLPLAPSQEATPLAAPVTSAQAADALIARAREAAPVEKPNETAQHRPATLNAPRGGLADDLKIIKGIGPKLEQMCHRMGYFHFDQIANWTEPEVAWVDENLEGFKGRVTRDRWVVQAKVIVEIGPEEFLKQLAAGREF
jgi:predicted flap endonuclease-1-like 5' DNA nuclease